FVGDLDHAAGVHHVVRRVEDPAVREVLLHTRVGQLVVGGAADDLGGEHRHGVVVERPAQRTGGVDVQALGADQRVGVGDVADTGRVPVEDPAHRVLADIGDDDLGALGPQVLHQVVADLAHARDADLAVPQRRVAPQVLCGGAHALVDAEGGEHGGVARAAVLRGAPGGPAALARHDV